MKKLFMQFFITFFTLLILIGGFVFIIDPFYHYHAPTAGIAAYMSRQVYQTPGAALHFEYDSAIVGSSMTENFRSSWFEELNLHTLKLSYSGARSLDIRGILDMVYESGNEIKYIFMDVNDYQLSTEPNQRYTNPPEYLYNNVWWQDAEYLWNNDVFWMSAGRLAENITGNQPDLDDAYTWEDPELFGAERVKDDCRSYIDELTQKRQDGSLEPYDIDELYEWCNGNLDNIIPVIDAHPETEFIIFYPPYSILYWEEQLLSGQLDGTLQIYKHSIEELMQHDNVRVCYFQDEEKIITNLDNYRDVCHYTPQINRYIFDCISNGEREITPDNIEEHFSNMYAIASEYPYDEIWTE